MVSVLTWPQCGQVSVDCRMISVLMPSIIAIVGAGDTAMPAAPGQASGAGRRRGRLRQPAGLLARLHPRDRHESVGVGADAGGSRPMRSQTPSSQRWRLVTVVPAPTLSEDREDFKCVWLSAGHTSLAERTTGIRQPSDLAASLPSKFCISIRRKRTTDPLQP